MPLPRPIMLAVAAGLLTAVLPATAMAAPDGRPGSPTSSTAGKPIGSPPGLARSNAPERALQVVQAAFQRPEEQTPRRAGATVRGGELTQQLVQLRLGLDELSPQDRRLAEAYLARPTDGTEWYGANYSRRARPTNDCTVRPTRGSDVCVHWARRTGDAPPRGDKDGDGLPNQVEKTRDTLNHVWNRVVVAGGYKRPLRDAEGPNRKLDVYLVDIGWDGLYGYCSPENVGQGRAHAAYCVLDDDYSSRQYQTSTTSVGNLQVTATHEFFHAVQFAYDVREDAWLMENTATWIEDEIYDVVNDNRHYLPHSALRHPERPLDTAAGSFVYGNWIWWRYLTERFDDEAGTGLPVLVREVWNRADATVRGGTYSMAALDQTLSQRYGAQLARVFADFSAFNRAPEKYEEAGETALYRKAALSATHPLTETRRAVARTSTTLQHLSGTTVAFVPESGYAGAGWTIDVAVDLPSSAHEPVAQVTVFPTVGAPRPPRTVPLSGDGTGTLREDFGSGQVRRVELTLSNGGHAYDCNQGTGWSCRGVPGRAQTFGYSATTSQRP